MDGTVVTRFDDESTVDDARRGQSAVRIVAVDGGGHWLLERARPSTPRVIGLRQTSRH